MFKYIIPAFLIVTALKAQENNNLKWLEYEPIFRYGQDGSILHEKIEPDMIGLKNDSLNNFSITVEGINENSLGITKEKSPTSSLNKEEVEIALLSNETDDPLIKAVYSTGILS